MTRRKDPVPRRGGEGEQKGTLPGVSQEEAAWGVGPKCARQGTGGGLSLGTCESYILRFPKGLSLVMMLISQM